VRDGSRSGFDTVIYEKRGAVAWVTLNRPASINAYNLQMRDDLWEVLFAVDHDPDVRAMVLSGAGAKGFCAGADLTEFGTAPSQMIARRVRWERDVFGRLYGLSKPTVAAVHGHVIGSGVELALLCDLRIASEDARFALPETSLGLVPAAGGTQTLPRMVGYGRALSMVLEGAELDAVSALRTGLVSRVVPLAQLRAAAGRISEDLARLSPASVESARQALRAAWRLPLHDGLLAEARSAARLSAELTSPSPTTSARSTSS
jgi:enoyl-CoA hydratase/carnithine racemase